MKPGLFFYLLLIALPLPLAAQTNVLLQKSNVSGRAGSVQTFYLTVTYDTLTITINGNPSGSYGNAHVQMGPANEPSIPTYSPFTSNTGTFKNIPGGAYQVVVTGQSDFYGLDFSITESGPKKIPSFFIDEVLLSGGISYLAFPNGKNFGYFAFLSDPAYIYHFDLGYEYVFDANDGNSGVVFYDFASGHFFYTSPTFSFPYLYDFNLKAFLYYYPDPNSSGRYNTNGVRYFFNFSTGRIISM